MNRFLFQMIVVAALVAIILFSPRAPDADMSTDEPASTSTPPAAGTPAFRGPTGAPYIKGPPGPPPNY